MARGGARRKDKWRRDLRLVSKYLRHDAAPYKDCAHEDVRWTFSATSLPAILCQDCGLLATGGSVVMARLLAAVGGTPPKPPTKSPKGKEASLGGVSISPETLAELEAATTGQAAPGKTWGSESGPEPHVFGIPIVVSPLMPSATKLKLVLEAYNQGIVSKQQAESIIGLPIVGEAPGQGDVGKLSEHWAIPADKAAELLKNPLDPQD